MLVIYKYIIAFASNSITGKLNLELGKSELLHVFLSDLSTFSSLFVVFCLGVVFQIWLVRHF